MVIRSKGNGTVSDTLKRFSVRALRPSDAEQLRALLRTRDEIRSDAEADERARMVEWIAFNNPFAGDELTYSVAEEDGRIVAIHGRMPVDFSIGRERLHGYYVHDLYVHADHRKKGLGFFLTKFLADHIQQTSRSFFCLFGMTPLNQLMQRRFRYHEQFCWLYVKPLNPENDLQKFTKTSFLTRWLSKPLRFILSAVDALTLPGSRSVTVRKVPRCGREFDELSDRLRERNGICSIKSSAYLNWKFVDRPFPRDTIFGAWKNGALCGFVVVAMMPKRDAYPRGTIIDIMADPEDSATIAALLRTTVNHFREAGTHSIECMVTDSRYAAVLKRFLFIRKKVRKLVLFGNLDRVMEHREMLADISSWHITFGESDSFMLSR